MMEAGELLYFDALRNKVAAAFCKNHPGANPDMREWKGQDIADFQEELIIKVKGRISEKWFYTHIKTASDRVPRIDMLNMLSTYAGYENWNHFKNTITFPEKEPGSETQVQTIAPSSFPRRKALLIILALFCMGLALLLVFSGAEHTYRCCFVDMDGHTPVHSRIRVKVKRTGESPVYAETDEKGCLELSEKEELLEFIISTPYFRPDTLVRRLTKKLTNETIQLRTDDYALMIHYFSQSDRKDWEKRRAQLKEMISDEAKIIQVFEGQAGMELYNRQEFIDKLTMPLKSLRNLEITTIKYSGKQISELRFIQKDKP
ncbi:MAG TPA: hypothetical protein VNZ86_12635 [Bacteroidia bacterium]|jgi:hypothetical protein|nr:hypothetical protein [Bacteroidia bacterium]